MIQSVALVDLGQQGLDKLIKVWYNIANHKNRKVENKMNLQNKLKNRQSEQKFTFQCVDCGESVTMNLGEILFYDDKSLVVPCRCKKCKDKKNERFLTTVNTVN